MDALAAVHRQSPTPSSFSVLIIWAKELSRQEETEMHMTSYKVNRSTHHCFVVSLYGCRLSNA